MSEAPLESLHGRGAGRLDFEDIDQDYHLKIRAFIKFCMPAVFGHLERTFDLRSLRDLQRQ